MTSDPTRDDEDERLLPPASARTRPFHWPFREGEVRAFDVVVCIVTLAVIAAAVAWSLGLL